VKLFKSILSYSNASILHRTSISTILILAFSVNNLLGQTAKIEGYIVQAETNAVLQDASVYIANSSLGAISNGKGYFIIENVPAGKHTIVIGNVGYGTKRKTVKVKEGEKLSLDFILEEAVMALPQIVVSSVTLTGGSKGVHEIPGSAYYISPKEIEKFSYTDINRTLRAVPGINIQEEDGFGLRPNIGLRGTGVERSSKITIMEDGVLMAPAPYAAPAAYYFPTIGRMQAVEVLKGSSQIKYGPYTTGGAINLISTQIPQELSGKINLFAGSFGSRNLHAFAGSSMEHIGYSVETFQYSADGFKVLDGDGNTGFDKKDYLAKLRINTKADAKVYQSLSLKIAHSTESSNETYLGLTQEDFDANPYRRYAASQVDLMKTEQTQFMVRHVASIMDGINITTSAYRSDFSRNWYKLDKVEADTVSGPIKIASILDDPDSYLIAYNAITGAESSIDDAFHLKANNRSYYSQGVQTVLGYKFNTGKVVNNVEIGARIHQDQIDRFQWVDKYRMDDGYMKMTTKGTPGTESNKIESADAFATYIQIKSNYKHLTIIPGLRYEHILVRREDYGKGDVERTGADLSKRSNLTEVFIPGVGLDYKFNSSVSSFGGVHKGFSPPGSKEGTLPESSTNYELGIRINKRALSGQAVVFLNDYSNLLGTDLAAAGGGGTTDQFNGGEVVAKGLETMFSYNLLTKVSTRYNLPVTIVYTYTDAVFVNDFDSDFDAWGEVSSGDHLPYIATDQLGFQLGIENKIFGFNLSGKYVDEMRTKAGQGTVRQDQRTDSQLVLDFSGNFKLSNHISLSASITNLTNDVNVVARRPAGLRPGMPRAFNVGIKTTF